MHAYQYLQLKEQLSEWLSDMIIKSYKTIFFIFETQPFIYIYCNFIPGEI